MFSFKVSYFVPRKCLDLIEDRPVLLQSELDLIGALAILDDFSVNILPVQGIFLPLFATQK